jgi:hypothetical protein
LNGGVKAGRSIVAAAKAAAQNKTVQALAATAGAAAAKQVGPVVQQWREHRRDRDRAMKLARQMGGRVSEETIIDGEPHVVVWKDGRPVQAFPPVADLADRPELIGFDERLAMEPPPLPPPRRFPGRHA